MCTPFVFEAAIPAEAIATLGLRADSKTWQRLLLLNLQRIRCSCYSALPNACTLDSKMAEDNASGCGDADADAGVAAKQRSHIPPYALSLLCSAALQDQQELANGVDKNAGGVEADKQPAAAASHRALHAGRHAQADSNSADGACVAAAH
jgi:hypothetical protein